MPRRFVRVRVKRTFMGPQKNTTDGAIMKHSISLSTVFNLDLISMATEYHSLETLLIKTAKQQELEDDLKAVCAFYKDNFDQEMLYAQLQTFGVHFQKTYQLQSKEASTKMTIFDINSYFLSLSHG